MRTFHIIKCIDSGLYLISNGSLKKHWTSAQRFTEHQRALDFLNDLNEIDVLPFGTYVIETIYLR